MSDTLQTLLDHNRDWAAQTVAQRPDFFTRLAQQQSPQYMWIGCSDSRVPANQITGLEPGEVFVHRNVANVLVHTDLNALSALQYAVDALKVQHVIVCGHLGCGGVRAAHDNLRVGLADNWLRHIKDVHTKHAALLATLSHGDSVNALCRLNVIEQVLNVTQTTVVQDAWARGQSVTVHGWVYDLSDGLLRDQRMSVSHTEELEAVYAEALAGVSAGISAGV